MRSEEEIRLALAVIDTFWERSPTEQEFMAGIISGMKWVLGDIESVTEGLSGRRQPE